MLDANQKMILRRQIATVLGVSFERYDAVCKAIEIKTDEEITSSNTAWISAREKQLTDAIAKAQAEVVAIKTK